jgi:hypothetical protein
LSWSPHRKEVEQPAGSSTPIQNVGIPMDRSSDLSWHRCFPRRIDHCRPEARTLHRGCDRFHLSTLHFSDEIETISRGKRHRRSTGLRYRRLR